jgi:hypothetical protein
MSTTLIPVESDVLVRLLDLRKRPSESFDDILRRVLPHRRETGQECGHPDGSLTNTDGHGHDGHGRVRYTLLGQRRAAPDAATAMIDILATLSQRRPDFLERLVPKVRGRTRNHLARSRTDVYPRRPDLAQYAREVVPGWYVGSNIANREKETILRAACSLAGLTFGRDLVINLGLE